MEHSMNTFLIIAGFTIIALASRRIGRYFTRAKLPLISGFLFTGMIAGPLFY
jgi:Kef-type K+ transport system membrane component KefB